MRKLLFLLAAVLMLAIQTIAQSTKTIAGRITDDKGIPLSGATVYVNDRLAKQTDSDGGYSIAVPTSTTRVTVSYVGYTTKIVELGNKSQVNVALQLEDKLLSEVVVTGLGAATSKRRLGISVESVNLNNQVKVPTGDVAQQLVGQVAGGLIASTNGNPGRPLNILLRGINTIQGGTQPMILIDGIEAKGTSLQSLDVNIFERVEIVQGAAAASLYGAQGANGVIQLFTKKAKAGKFNIDFSTSYGNNELLNVGGLSKANAHAFATDANGNVVTGSGAVMTLDPATLVYNGDVVYNSLGLTSYQEKPYNKNLQYYDHFAMFYQRTTTTNNSLTISGSGNKVDFLLSASNNKQESPFVGNGGQNRTNVTTKVGVELMKGMKLTSLTQLIYTKNDLKDATGRTYVFNVNNSRPFANFAQKDLDGNYGNFFGAAVGVNHNNQFNWNQYYSNVTDRIDLIQTITWNYKPIKYVEFDAKYALNYANSNNTYRYEDQVDNKNMVLQSRFLGSNGGTGSTTGEIGNTVTRTTFQNFIGTINLKTDFEKDFKSKLPIRTTTTVAFDYRNSFLKQFYAWAFDAPGFYPWNATQANNQRITTDYIEPFITYGFLANQKIEWSDIFGFAVGVRSDYSSAFGAGAKAQTFPRGDFYLNIQNFNFWKKSKIADRITDWKIRAGYGEAGIQPGAFQRFATLPTATLGASNVFRYNITNPNPDLSVELSKELEIGTDIGIKLSKGQFLQNANIAFTYWKRSTDNAIYSVDAAASTGVGGRLDNAFGLTSSGIQASLNLTVLNNKNLSWDFTTNYSRQNSEISYVNGPPVILISSAGSVGITLAQGLRIGQIFGFKMMKQLDEINPQTGKVFLSAADQANHEVTSTGWVVNKATKQAVTLPGQYPLGDPNPKFNMSFINNFRIKNFVTINMQWDWIYGNQLYNQTKQWMYRDGIHSDYGQYLTINGESHAYTAFYRSMYAGGAANGTKNYFMEDGSFWRLRNISFSFNLLKLYRWKAVQSLDLILSGRNALTFTKYSGMDPEVSSSTTNSSFDRGLDHNTIPNTRTFSVGLNIGF